MPIQWKEGRKYKRHFSFLPFFSAPKFEEEKKLWLNKANSPKIRQIWFLYINHWWLSETTNWQFAKKEKIGPSSNIAARNVIWIHHKITVSIKRSNFRTIFYSSFSFDLRSVCRCRIPDGIYHLANLIVFILATFASKTISFDWTKTDKHREKKKKHFLYSII